MTVLAPLGSVAEFTNGKAFKPTDWVTDGIPIIRIQNLTNPSAPFNKYNGAVEQRYYVNDGDLLVSWSATLDVFIWDRGPAVLNQHIFRVVPDQEKIQKKFLYYALQHVMDELRAQTHGVTMKHITRGPFEQTKIPLPPPSEQERIVRLLDEADEVRHLRKQAEARIANFIPALFHEMFGDPTTNEKKWKTKSLGDLLEKIDSGWSPVCLEGPARQDEWGILKLGAVTYCEYDDSQNKAFPPDIKPRSDLEVKAGDVLFSRKNTYDLVAACVFVFETRPKLMLSDLTFRLRIRDKNELVPVFLWQTLINANKRKEVQALASGAAAQMPNISKARLMTAEIPIPPIALQREFAARVSEARKLQTAQAASAKRMDALFQSMLARAFAGEL